MTDVGGIAADRLKAFVERVERLAEERDGIAADIRDVFAEAKSTGFDVPTMRKIIRLRAMEREDRVEQAELLALYAAAVGLDDFNATPLGASVSQIRGRAA